MTDPIDPTTPEPEAPAPPVAAPPAAPQEEPQEAAQAAPQATNGTNGTATPEDAPDEFFEQLERLLDKLVPPPSVTVTTCSGDELQLPGAIPARAQVKVFRHMRDLLELDQITGAVEAMQGQGTASGMVEMVVALATDEAVAEKLAAIFRDAYPDVLDGSDPLDVLPLEELVLALVPFSQRFVKRLGTGITSLAKGASDLQA